MTNVGYIDWILEQVKLTKPSAVYWVDGSREDLERLIGIGMNTEKIDNNPVFVKLNDDVFPNSLLHRSHPSDVARTEHLTYVCLPKKEDAGPNNNWMPPEEAKEMMSKLFNGCMQGRTMYVIPYLLGHPDSPHSKVCVQITDSVYVAVSMCIMTRVGKEARERIGDSNNFVKGIHSLGELDPQRRWIMHFPHENLVMSFGSGYGGNALLSKKCFSLRIASYLGHAEGWLAEHMIIIGVEDPAGNMTYFLGAFPSACGKTNLALITPPMAGYKVHVLGDDIAWIHVGDDGRLYAVNPETGFFGVAPGTSYKTNPKMMDTLKNDRFQPTLFTNVALDSDNNSPWWEGLGERPKNLVDWQGNPYDSTSGKTAAHPNSRFTVSIYNCPTISKEFDNPVGVPISGIIFGIRRTNTIPLVRESFDWDHGVFLSSIMGSETTAAASSQSGIVRRDPMAMVPFCGYNMADYFRHWLEFKTRIKHMPKIFMVNWFMKDDKGNFLWPGFGENFRILKWMMDRISNKVSAVETPLGVMPDLNDLDLSGLNIKEENLGRLFEINKEEWKNEIDDIEKFYAQFGERIPVELKNYLKKLKDDVS